jgi:protein tyrosine phosphatase (PTP) superfamily phosphohydrolase (DUF442 family)
MPKWIREGELAISTRPGYQPGAEFSVSREVVDSWAEEMQEAGIASIICLLADDQLPLYDRALPDGLLRYYAMLGFEVAHVPTPDGLREPFTPEQLEAAWRAYQRLPKPVLVHCSAGFDRTGRVVRYIEGRLDGAKD